MADNAAREWLATFRSTRSRDVTGETTERWREHRRVPGRDAEELLEGLAARLVEMQISVVRCSLSLLPLHPEIYALNLVWTRGKGVERFARTHEYVGRAELANTPLAAIKRGSPAIRVRLGADSSPEHRSNLATIAGLGATDFFIVPLILGDGRRSFFWCAVDQPAGFTASQLEAIEQLAPLLAPRVDAASWEESTELLLDTYLGVNAARRVLTGAFKRGTGETLKAVIWFCDLRGFTSLVDSRPVNDVIPLLNRYFETMAAPVEDAGGEILKFIGDAMLAVFHVDERGAAPRCEQALGAATAALDALAKLSRDEPAPLKAGIALHVGEVMYGNIGARTRLDFTVIGPAVNEASRVESLCKELGAPLLVTGAFQRAAGQLPLLSLGRHALR
ncbi:MAG TPA: adenylate/guanylate cyclase domain-containing protein, partial [Steroidobacteraceae bacterium]|nr:adenylate/guanylate cyclase domain-containing protein [Steroidobacteraceae bacterium]